jgi:F-type H+-transporting ATPase subunit epsilon
MAHPAFDFEVITPDGASFQAPAESVRLPGADGSFGILARHAPLLGALEAGVMLVTKPSGPREVFAVGDGFVEVSGKKTRVVVDFCDPKASIDVARAERAKVRAEERLKKSPPDLDMARCEASLRRAIVRLTVARFELLD